MIRGMSSTLLPTTARTGGRWIDHWLDGVRDIENLRAGHPMMDAVIEEIDGRMIRVGEHWLADFASCNYLGFDLDREIIESVPAYLEAWGTHPSWSRLLGSPVLYEQIETRLTELLGCEDSLVLPTITHIHASVIPVLAASGTIFLDARAHKTIYDGCQVARSRGAAVRRFRFEDPEHLDELLARRSRPRAPGVHGRRQQHDRQPARPARLRGGDAPPRRAAVRRRRPRLRRDRRARAPGELLPYGSRGNSIVRHFGESYEDLVLVGGFSKAYSSLLAFIACPTEIKNLLKVAAPPYLYSGPSPVASLATVLAGFEVNEQRGDELRSVLHRHTVRVLEALRELDVHTPNRSELPIIEMPLRDHERIGAVGELLLAGRLRHAGRLPAGAQGGGGLPRAAHRGQHRRRGRHADRRPRASWPSRASSSPPPRQGTAEVR